MTEKELSIEEFLIRNIKAVPRVDVFWARVFQKYESWLINWECMSPFWIILLLTDKELKMFCWTIQMLLEEYLPYLLKYREIHYFRLPSVGPFHVLHDHWEQPINDDRSPEQLKLMGTSNWKVFYSRAMKKDIQQKLECIGNIKPNQVIYSQGTFRRLFSSKQRSNVYFR